jgi:non-ribosomal peptide synthetase-like protein
VGKPVETLSTHLTESPSTSTASALAEILADLLDTERVPIDSHFFDDLGANSLVMAHFCARVRKQEHLPSVSMKDIYRHPTIGQLATSLDGAAPTSVQSRAPAESPTRAPTEIPTPIGTLNYFLCGALQMLCFVGYCYLGAFLIVIGADWISAGSGLLDTYLRLMAFAGAALVGLCVLPIAAKWMLIGRWKPRRIRVWSLTYVRFWLVKTLVQRTLVVALFLGSPLYVLYLKALGAKIGRGVAIFSRNVPVCTDLLTIGDGTVIRKDSFFQGYRVDAGVIQTGAITIGRDAFVGERSVIDIDATMGDRAQLGHVSSLHPNQTVPDGECWHGSPAQRADLDYQAVGPAECGAMRRTGYGVMQLLAVLFVYLPFAVGGVDLLLAESPRVSGVLETPKPGYLSWGFYSDVLETSFVVFFCAVIIGLLAVGIVPRLLNLTIKPDKVYRLYGFHYSAVRAIRLMTNSKFFLNTFGDSSYIVPYLRYLGYDLSRRPVQTGSNFGTQLQHETPFLSSIGRGTMVADGLSLINAHFSSTSFRVSRASIGADNFVGNFVVYPGQGRTGDNCLLGTKLLVPIDGEVRENTGLLGSPSFPIPRSVERDRRFDNLKSEDELRHRLPAKNRHNTVTIVMFLLSRWLYFAGITLLGWTAADLYAYFGVSAIALASVVGLLFSVVYFAVFERIVTFIHPVRPLYCSIYDRRFWRHERFWKSAATKVHLTALNGTPFKNVLWRVLGARVGRKVFDDGCTMTERLLVTVGDGATLNAGANLQGHSQEDGTFKSDHINIGAGSTVGVNGWVHYGVAMGDGAVLAANSFLMKGEEVPQRSQWAGNPAREIP